MLLLCMSGASAFGRLTRFVRSEDGYGRIIPVDTETYRTRILGMKLWKAMMTLNSKICSDIERADRGRACSAVRREDRSPK